ncbi:Methylthioribose-1-phosphate isomerase [Armadillidium nasatum]|uniref:Methylthioribose-1-phosphate isomerase n=1 Tax=Armadillidium nasatum TaxID=96803 RepID=A0A5N5SP14_9CRUS|nr:Methylthioribose-1-phosphate isomerase [Armadillidium nasatum]
MTLEAIKWKDGKLQILDQLLLPLECKFIDIDNTKEGWEVINKMQVRGAPAIAIVGCLSLAAELQTCFPKFASKSELHKFIKEKIIYLISARPTAVNMKISGEDLIMNSRKLLDSEISLLDYKEKVIGLCVQMLESDVTTNKTLSKFGCDFLLKELPDDNNVTVLTHCNTGSLATAGYGTALGMIRTLHSRNRLGHVYCTETRPYNQGARLTAYELVFEKMPATLICDDMVGALMKIRKVNAVIVGSDRIARNGDTANKIGTYQLAVLAKHHNVPFYVCAPTTSIDMSLKNGSDIPIEERPENELSHIGKQRIAAPGIKCWNPAFDVTPAELISGGIVTEKGVFAPDELFSKLSVGI